MTLHQIPPAALAQHIAVLGKAGSGKTYAIRGVVEALLDANARVCIIDPTGAWYGLRTLADGKRAGYPVAIFGGSHADFPLGGQHGEELAEIIGTSSTPAIIDTSLLRTGERVRLFTDLAEGLLRKNRGPLHLVIDEAHLFAPQGRVSDPQSAAMLHAANNLVSLGRVRGLRVTMITQRPAKLHKDSLTQVETLVAMRLIAPQDRKAVEEWIKDNADETKARQILSSLATMKTGTGWVWAPELGILEQVAFPKIKTFDSGRAPDGGSGSGPVLAPIDRDAIAGRLKAVAQEAIDNDPKRLRARITELEREAKKRPDASMPPIVEAEAEKRGYDRARTEFRAKAAGDTGKACGALKAAAADLSSLAIKLEREAPEWPLPKASYTVHPQAPRAPATDRALAKMATHAAGIIASTGEVGSGGKRRILIALAQYPQGLSTRKLSILVDIAPSGGTWRTYMAELRGNGWIVGSGEHIQITPGGLQALGSYDPLPTGQALIDYWRTRLGASGKRAIFDAVVDVYPETTSVEQVSARTGIAKDGGTWRTYLAELRGLGLVVGRGELGASDDLFS